MHFNFLTVYIVIERLNTILYHAHAILCIDSVLTAARSPDDPQWWLAGSVHPYAPFVGNALKWESYVYDDGSTYVMGKLSIDDSSKLLSALFCVQI